ncbi:serine palmitoyltransferase 2-like isoform X2 [Gigantopelta aegis]|uniref:serine palmitoyltransferase 2-like isoform X2 n=1 Tax=Gigantopelta aegis TaxID=1735272 RepID=UPI001B88C29E|nr:serine palmitoyltransferase 2-like isoform X2 [Gigantopelta aegis]
MAKPHSPVKKTKNGVLNGKHEQTVERTWRDDFHESFEETPLIAAMYTYLSYIMLAIFGHIRDVCYYYGLRHAGQGTEPEIKGFVPLYSSWENFFLRHMYRLIRDSWDRPVGSVAGAKIDILERVSHDHCWHFELTGKRLHVLNFGSYNYLGFGENKGPCVEKVEEITKQCGLGIAASRQDYGYMEIHKELDELVADFLGLEAAITFPMGFATNSMNLPCLVRKGCLILSDDMNHASIVLGAKLSGAVVKIFKHNDAKDLEHKLKESIIHGQPKSMRPWKKILIVVEGIHSMEGSILPLPDIIKLKKKYKAYIYLDEAHSIGALGPHGRGVTDYFGIDPKEIDVMMGTFTKSFASAGGYIAGSKKLINYLRVYSHSSVYSCVMSPPIAQQIIASMKIIMGLDGTGEGQRRINQLLINARYFRRGLHKIGVIVYGNRDSPVVPLLIYNPSKISLFSRETLKRGLATVVVGFPATALIEGRARFCVSAAHTKEMMDEALRLIAEVADIVRIRFSRLPLSHFCIDDVPFPKESS